MDKEFLLGEGSSFAYLKTVAESDYKHFTTEILSSEGVESSRIVGGTQRRKLYCDHKNFESDCDP